MMQNVSFLSVTATVQPSHKRNFDLFNNNIPVLQSGG